MDGSGGQDAYALAAGMAGVPELSQARSRPPIENKKSYNGGGLVLQHEAVPRGG